jgi:hypothetical protein
MVPLMPGIVSFRSSCLRSSGTPPFTVQSGSLREGSPTLYSAKAVLKGGGNPLQGVLGSLGGLQTSIQNEWKNQEADFQAFGKDVCQRVVSLEDSRKALVGTLK